MSAYSTGRVGQTILSRHQQVIPGHKCAATVGETDEWIRHGEMGGGGRRREWEAEGRGEKVKRLAVKSLTRLLTNSTVHVVFVLTETGLRAFLFA